MVGVENGKLNLAPELIKTSHMGAENAANISALTWQALEELKNSGVKTYYTAEELRKMAYDIRKNGLPRETVKALKAQGWTDDQIQALEEYIAKNADNINEDFNMKAFLKEFSTAFIDVAFKYNEYEVWALEKWKWAKPAEAPTSDPILKAINPVLTDAWVQFYRRYSQEDYLMMETNIRDLRDTTYRLLTEGRLFLIESKKQIISHATLVKDGGIVFIRTQYKIDKESGKEMFIQEKYYWPKALEAYRLMGDIYALVKARNLGNQNAKLERVLNQKVAELKNALVVSMISYDKKIRDPIRSPKPPKPIPIDPIKPPGGPTPPMEVLTGKSSTSNVDDLGNIVKPELLDDPVAREALDVNSNEGVLHITGIDVVVDSDQPGRVEYHIKVRMNAENNVVSNVRIKVRDYTSGDSDSGSVSFIDVGDTHTWSSKKFVYSHSSSGTLTVSGKVEITYTPSCGPVPKSKDPRVLSTPSSCGDRTITRSYSATINLKSQVDWSRVNVRLEAFPKNVEEGGSVTYRLIVENNQDASINGIEYSVTIPISLTRTQRGSGTVSLGPWESKTVYTKTVAYPEASTYTATASIYWNGYSKSDSESVTVFSPGYGGSEALRITSVNIMPENPAPGDTVVFDVAIENPASGSKTATVKLFIDGVEKSSKTTTIGSGGSGVVSLTWTAQAGEHAWKIEVRRDGKLEDSRSGSLEVSWTPTSLFEVELIAYPTELEGGGTVTFIVKVWNHDSSALSLSGFVQDEDGTIVKSIDGFKGRVPAGAQNYTLTAFTLDVYGVGIHTFKLFLDNYDGKPNGAGEEHWDEVTVEVKPTNGTELKQVGFECDDLYFDFRDRAYRATLVCKVYLYNPLESALDVKDVAVLHGYSLGDLEDVTGGSLSTGEWAINPSAFSLNPQETKTVTFSLPLEIGSWVPISVSDATEVVSKYGEHVTINYQYTLGYTYDGSEWKHFEGEVQEIVQVKVDTSTVAADYLLSGGMAIIDPNTAISFSVGSLKISGLRLNLKLGFDPWAFIWNGFLKPYILERT